MQSQVLKEREKERALFSSKPIIEFVKLIEKMLTEAVSTDNEVLFTRFHNYIPISFQNNFNYHILDAPWSSGTNCSELAPILQYLCPQNS